MKQSDFEYQITFAECAKHGAEPSLIDIIEKYYSISMPVDEANALANRYIAQMIAETQSGE